MANGLEAERALVEGLEQRGFTLARLSDEDRAHLDEVLKVDCVILRPPQASTCFFPAPIAVQITGRPMDLAKRAEFAATAQDAVAPRLAYVELGRLQITVDFVNAAACGLEALFYEKSAPQVALLRVGRNRFEISDLQVALEGYRGWLATIMVGDLTGTINHWDPQGRFGFITAEIPAFEDPNGRPTFFFHTDQVENSALRARLTSGFGQPEAVGTLVTFKDGGQNDTTRWRKMAVKVRLQGG